MDGTSLEYQSGFFDAVFCYHYLAHMPKAEREQAALEAERVLKRGGKLYFKEFGTKDFRVGKGTEVEPNTFKRHGGILTHYFTEEETRKLFAFLQLYSFESEQWRVTLRGKEYPREMLHAIFAKEQV
jgi:ubiquinone/menaquinone biosynthesis C-methylase UbiE